MVQHGATTHPSHRLTSFVVAPLICKVTAAMPSNPVKRMWQLFECCGWEELRETWTNSGLQVAYDDGAGGPFTTVALTDNLQAWRVGKSAESSIKGPVTTWCRQLVLDFHPMMKLVL